VWLTAALCFAPLQALKKQSEPSQIVGVVDKPQEVAGSFRFPGLYTIQLPEQPFIGEWEWPKLYK
jgi:hypothetical protein